MVDMMMTYHRYCDIDIMNNVITGIMNNMIHFHHSLVLLYFFMNELNSSGLDLIFC